MLEATLKPLCPPYVFSRRQFQLQLQVAFLLSPFGKWNVKSATAQQFKREKTRHTKASGMSKARQRNNSSAKTRHTKASGMSKARQRNNSSAKNAAYKIQNLGSLQIFKILLPINRQPSFNFNCRRLFGWHLDVLNGRNEMIWKWIGKFTGSWNILVCRPCAISQLHRSDNHVLH